MIEVNRFVGPYVEPGIVYVLESDYDAAKKCAEEYGAKVIEQQSELAASKNREMALLSSIETANADLAALREELTEEKARYARDVDSADEETSALREIIRDLKDWRKCSQSLAAFASILDRAESVIPAPGPMRKALTDAEQRNAEGSAAMQIATKLLEQTLSALNPRNSLAYEVRHFLAAHCKIKPTESGASE